MTDKEQMMINGVDVSGCEYVYNTPFGKKGCKHPMMKNIYCHQKLNCCYKQLARKTQECEQLKEKQKIIGKAIYKESIELFNENARYRKALEEIEKHIESYKEQCNIPNNCVDNRLCSTCFLGSADELGEDILNIINRVKGNKLYEE